MRATLTVNGRAVVTSYASGFDSEKFNDVRFHILRSASYWKGAVREAKKDLEIAIGLVNKYKRMAKDFSGEVKSLSSDLFACWDSIKEAEDSQHPSRIMMISIAENLEAVLKDHINDFNIGNNGVLLDALYEGGAFRTIDFAIELTSEEEEEFGISKWKLIALRFKTGLNITKVRKGGDYVYSLNLDALCPALNFSALLYGHPELLSVFAPIVACYMKEAEEAVAYFNKSWDSVKNPTDVLPSATFAAE